MGDSLVKHSLPFGYASGCNGSTAEIIARTRRMTEFGQKRMPMEHKIRRTGRSIAILMVIGSDRTYPSIHRDLDGVLDGDE